MVASFIIVFRETLEASLIIGIVLSYLERINARSKFRQVWYGTVLGIGISIGAAFVLTSAMDGFTGVSEKIFEGVTFLIGAALLTTFILWIMKEERYSASLHEKIDVSLTNRRILGIFFLVFISILREGIETVIFFQSLINIQESAAPAWIGSLLGAALAVIAGVLIYFSEKKISLKRFFQVTNIILIFFAAGMIAYGIHELQEAGIIPIVIEHMYNINPPVLTEGVYPILHEKGAVGSILKGLLGYNGNPSLFEVISYIIYIALIGLFWLVKSTNKVKKRYS